MCIVEFVAARINPRLLFGVFRMELKHLQIPVKSNIHLGSVLTESVETVPYGTNGNCLTMFQLYHVYAVSVPKIFLFSHQYFSSLQTLIRAAILHFRGTSFVTWLEVELNSR